MNTTATRTYTSHATCTHAATPAGRKACRDATRMIAVPADGKAWFKLTYRDGTVPLCTGSMRFHTEADALAFAATYATVPHGMTASLFDRWAITTTNRNGARELTTVYSQAAADTFAATRKAAGDRVRVTFKQGLSRFVAAV